MLTVKENAITVAGKGTKRSAGQNKTEKYNLRECNQRRERQINYNEQGTTYKDEHRQRTVIAAVAIVCGGMLQIVAVWDVVNHVD